MSKIKVTHKDSFIYVSSKLDRKETLNFEEIDILEKANIRGFMRLYQEKNRKLFYRAPEAIPLAKYLQKGIEQKTFLEILLQILEVIEKTEQYHLTLRNLIMDLSYIYISEATKIVYVIYQPLLNPNVSYNLFSCIYEMIHLTELDVKENKLLLEQLEKYLRSRNRFSPKEIKQHIQQKYMGSGKSYFEGNKRSRSDENETALLQSEWEEDEMETGLLQNEWNQEDEMETGLLQNEWNQEDEMETGLLQGEWKQDDGNETGLLQNEWEQEDEMETGILYEEDEEEAEEQVREACSSGSSYPYLIRMRDRVRTKVDKPVFRIGKERSYVDYFISNNNAVSRVHADIIFQNNRYYIRDNNSTNHTYVNGKRIAVHTEVVIENGDRIRLANEEFEFWISGSSI